MRYLIGPELFWLVLYACAVCAGLLNQPPNKTLDDLIEQSWFWIPVFSMVVFGLWWLPFVEREWLLLRVWVAGIIGGHLVIERTLRAYSEQGPGIGMGYLAGISLEFCVLILGSIVVKIRF